MSEPSMTIPPEGKRGTPGADLMDRAAGRVDRARRPVAERLHGMANGIRARAQSLFERERISESVSDAAHGAADTVDSSAAYLDSHDVSAIGQDIVKVVRQHPVKFLVAAAAVGFMCGRALRRH